VSPLALSLVLSAALLHAGWNLILKQVDEKFIVSWWSVLISAVLIPPAVLLQGWPTAEAWPFLIASAAVEALYMATLAAAYSLSDFSLAYPIARGSAPAFLALWATIFLGEHIPPMGGLGIALLVIGLMIVGSSGLQNIPQQAMGGAPHGLLRARLPGLLMALLTAVLISTYSTIDAAAVRRTPATSYTVVMIVLSGVIFTPFAVRGRGWRQTVQVGLRYWRQVLAIGAASILAYILVLNAYAIAPVSYAGAVREISVVFGALAGWKLLGEGLGRQRVIGAILIFAGVLLISSV
jgi:drug/metabolite transporter (DMT)-like permease